MSGIAPKLNPADFAHLTVVPLDTLSAVSGQKIEQAAKVLCREGWGHVLVHQDEDGNDVWTPLWRHIAEPDVGQPEGFPRVMTGYANRVGDNVDKFRTADREVWRDAPQTKTVQLLVFDNADDARDVVEAMAEVVRRRPQLGGAA